MKRLLFVVFTALIISLSYSGYFYLTLKRILPKVPNQLARTMDFLNTDTTNYDVIIIGSSRVYAHNDPHIIDSVCGVNSVCISIDGCTITQDVAMLEKYFARHKPPKLILVSLDYSSLQASMQPYNYPEYYPYLTDSIFGAENRKAIWRFKYSSICEKYDVFIKYSAKTDYQKLAALNSSLGVKHKFNNLGDEPAWYNLMTYYKGYSGINRSWTAESEADLQEEWTIPREPQGIDFLNDFINISKEHGSKPVIVFSPMFYVTKKQFGETDNFFATIEQLAQKQSIPFWDYSDDPICSNRVYFYNAFHLNRTGAEKFSAILATDINNYLRH